VDEVSNRKVLLFQVACCRRIWHLAPADCRAVVELAESRADGEAAYEDVAAACDAKDDSYDLVREIVGKFDSWEPWGYWDEVVSKAAMAEGGAASDQVSEPHKLGAFNLAYGAAEKSQADLLRDLLGNPHHLPELDPSWLTPTVVNLASVAYQERSLPSGELDPARLSVLADALEDAGCTDPDLLGHLRSPGPHVRGCWALDLILGKE
jgi:hypothetical protein